MLSYTHSLTHSLYVLNITTTYCTVYNTIEALKIGFVCVFNAELHSLTHSLTLCSKHYNNLLYITQ